MNELDYRRIAKALMDEVAATPNIVEKDVLTSAEAATYMGISRSGLYRLTMENALPYYKPKGKLAYFKRSEIDNFLTQNRVASMAEIHEQAMMYCYGRKR